MANKLKPLPKLETDEDAERFVDQADLTEYDLSKMKPAGFEFERKSARLTMRLPGRLLDTVKARAKARGIPYQRLIRETLENSLKNDH
jgi:predicted DNA binding CopG/RHH family protein